MAKIYEALERAQRERKGLVQHFGLPQPIEYDASEPQFILEGEMLGLYGVVDSLLPDTPKKIIQFIGSRIGEGTSTIAREFAMVAAMKIDQPVLLVDADRTHPSQHLYFRIPSRRGWVETVQEGHGIEESFCQVGDSRLFLSPCTNSAASTPEIFDSRSIHEFWQQIKQRFAFVLVDSPPLSSSPDGLAVAPRVDGVVLVLEAEKTRWRIAESIKERIIRVGGNLLGVVLNKRRYYIPESIYKRL
jgi:protein-tyrosine kinase